MPAKKKSKPVRVTRKFLLDLADKIYNTKTRSCLRLCTGTLQNGPDPKDPKRSMHCGLGELYFAMTGREPKEDFMTEDGVVELAVELSTVLHEDEEFEQERQKIRDLGLDPVVEDNLIEAYDAVVFNSEYHSVEDQFRDILNSIPDVNDSRPPGLNVDVCSYETYRTRARLVAKKLREAAKLLPE